MAEVEPDRDQPLLGTVLQVAFDATPLRPSVSKAA